MSTTGYYQITKISDTEFNVYYQECIIAVCDTEQEAKDFIAAEEADDQQFCKEYRINEEE